LQDNPDVAGNQRLIKAHKSELVMMADRLQEEMAEEQQFTKFKDSIYKEIEEQGMFDKLRTEERDLNA
jgi:hypothetical protein